MQDNQQEFIDFAISIGAIRFGEFKLKSGRISPYFFNAGLFDSGARIARLGKFYARTIMASGIEFDMLFGPAYKGIPLVITVTIALADEHGRDVPYAFNRKERKEYAEGGVLVGHALKGRVLIIDDVISSGLSANEAIATIRQHDASTAGLVIALDRQERGTTAQSAVQEMEEKSGIRVASIIKLETLIPYLDNNPELGQYRAAIEQYRQRYGI